MQTQHPLELRNEAQMGSHRLLVQRNSFEKKRPEWGPKVHVARTVESNRSAGSRLSTTCPWVEASWGPPEPRDWTRTTCCCPGALRPSLRKFAPRSKRWYGEAGHPSKPGLHYRGRVYLCPGSGLVPKLATWVPVGLPEASRVTLSVPRPPILPKGATIRGRELEVE